MKRYFPNAEIVRVMVGIPAGHRHLRTVIETSSGEQFLFQEATMANIVRAYTLIKTHPRRKAIELRLERLEDKKPRYAAFQLLETDRDEESISRELAQFPENGE
ncbi:MAG: hypothetical protein AB1611_15650 [bacterium]